MSKQSVAWHEECLRNATKSYERELARYEEERMRLEHTRVELAIYEYQIKRAKREAKDGFDREKYGKASAK